MKNSPFELQSMGKAEGSQRLCSASKAVQGLKALTSGCPKAKQSVKLCTETPWFALVHRMNSQPFSKEVGQATEADEASPARSDKSLTIAEKLTSKMEEARDHNTW